VVCGVCLWCVVCVCVCVCVWSAGKHNTYVAIIININ
jgi:hypothetical protein